MKTFRSILYPFCIMHFALCPFSSYAQKTIIDISSIAERTPYYYDGTPHIPSADDFIINRTDGGLVNTDDYTIEFLPDQDITCIGTKLAYIIAKNDYTFKIYGDTIGDGIGIDGLPNGNDTPHKIIIRPRTLDYNENHWQAYDKVYDGQTAAHVVFAPESNLSPGGNYPMGGILTEDAPYIKIDTVYAHFTNGKNVGIGKEITIDNVTLTLTQAGIDESKQYLLDQYTLTRDPDMTKSLFHYPGDKSNTGGYFMSGAPLTANIDLKQLTVAQWNIAEKIYDGTADPPEISVAGLGGIIEGDIVTPGAVTAVCNTANAGSATLTISGLALSGADASNYYVNATQETNITIKKRKLTGTWRVYDKPWDGNDTAYVWFDLTPATDPGAIVGREQVAFSAVGFFNSSDVGNDKPVTVATNNMTLIGDPVAATNNYELPDPPGADFKADIICIDNSLAGGTYRWFSQQNSSQTWTAPASGYYFCEAWGAKGGGDNAANGGYSGGWRWISPGQSIFVHTGERGKAQGNGTAWNGGGSAGTSGGSNQGGGGATDFRRESPGNIDGISNSDSRFLVAGGGGGRQATYGSDSNTGGGWFGGNGNGFGGTQTAGSASGNGVSPGGIDIMGGGGGWWGGGYISTATDHTSGGGSGYIGGVADGITANNMNPYAGYARISQLFEAKKIAGSYVYDGSPVTPTASDITITYLKKYTLTASDFAIVEGSYQNNINAGILTASFKFRVTNTSAHPGFCSTDTEYTANFTIEQREISINSFNIDKIYDGSRAAYPKVAFGNFILADSLDVKLNINLIHYNDKHVGDSKIATVTYYTEKTAYDKTPVFEGSTTYLIGDKRDNYKLNVVTPPGTTTGTITKRQLTANFSVDTKPYDGTTTAYISYTDLNIAGEDVVRLNVVGTYADAETGSGKTVTVSSISLNTDDMPKGGSNISQADFEKNYDSFSTSFTIEGAIRPFNLCTDVRPHVDFPYTGVLQEFEAQAGYEYRFEVWGAQGGSSPWGKKKDEDLTINNGYNGTTYSDHYIDLAGQAGGKGGYSKGNFLVPAAQSLYVYVGGTTTTTGTAGFNGGGGSGELGGGGATDISLATHVTNDTIKGDDPRIIVAGGGGGEADFYSGTTGGYGGGATGGGGGSAWAYTNVLTPPTGGTQDRGGYAYNGATGGGKGIGGYGAATGGGGGYYGGGGGATGSMQECSGGGGSGYAGSLNGLKYGQTVGGNTATPFPIAGNDIAGAKAVGRHGYARIGLLPTVHMKGASGADTVFYYKGEEQVPHHIVITIGPDTLTAGTDYDVNTITYANNTNATDSAECIIQGKGNYAGCNKWTFYYTINPLRIQCELTPKVIDVDCYLPDSDTPCEQSTCLPNKIYDSTDRANVKATIKNKDEIPADEREQMNLDNIAVDAYFTDGRNAGANKEIKVRGITIPGAMGSNYALDMDDPTALIFFGSICRRPLQYRFTGQDKEYDHADSAQVTIAVADTIKGKDVGYVPGDDLKILKFGAHFVESDSITPAWDVSKADKIRVDSLISVGTDAANYYLDTLNCSVTGGKILPLCLSGKTVDVKIQDQSILNIINTRDFNYTGGVQTFTAPVSGYYKLEAWGAAGGGSTSIYGRGGYVSGKTLLRAGDVLYIHVGEAGYINGRTGTYNGGGLTLSSPSSGGYSGGGATDFRTASGAWNDNLNTRLLVAGGGGGSDDSASDTNDGRPGSAGGLTGYTGSAGGNGGTQTAAGSGGTNYGSAGNNSAGGQSVNDGGGGGGGYFGGAGGNNNGGGGGGSSYINTAKFIAPLMIDGRGFVWDLNKTDYSQGSVTSIRQGVTEPNGDKSTYGHAGDGFARISYAGVLVDSIFTYTAANQEAAVEDIKIHTYADPDGLVVGRDFTVTGHADNFHVGTPSIIIKGTGNYTCEARIIAFAIHPYPVSVTPQAWCREYDGTDTVHIASSWNLPNNASQAIREDVGAGNVGNPVFSARFEDGKNIGENKPVEVLDFQFTEGKHYLNYTLDATSLGTANNLTATVWPRLVTGAWETIDKMYDMTDTAYVRLTPDNLKDPVSVRVVAHYANNTSNTDADAENKKNITVDSLVFSGEDAANYTWRKFATGEEAAGFCPTGDWTSAMPTNQTALIKPFCLSDNYTTFDFTAKQETQEFTAPHTGYYRLEAWGAQGGRYATNKGGMGAYTAGTILLRENEKIYVYVGLSNTAGTQEDTQYYWNGGGGTHKTSDLNYDYGGGATDFRVVAGSEWSDAKSLKSRIMVAAGGGGKGNNGNNIDYSAGGGLSNFTAYKSGQTYAAATNGAPGFGKGARGVSGASYSGAGGGWWGGTARATNEGASGGTSYISGHWGCVAVTDAVYNDNTAMTAPTVDANSQFKGTMAQAADDLTMSWSPTGKIFENTLMIDGQGKQWTTVQGDRVDIPKPDGTGMETGHAGDGHARITPLLIGIVAFEPGIDKLLVGANVLNTATTDTTNFAYTGGMQTFVAPYDGDYRLHVWGAQGGAGNGKDTQGEGGYSTGTVSLNKDDTLYVYVGGAGASGSSNSAGTYAGGFNGGGQGNYAGGGGATDIRRSATDALTGNSASDPRIIVAGGGGGGQRWSTATTGYGDDGDGGGVTGVQSGSVYSGTHVALTLAQPGTQTAGGKGAIPASGGSAGGDGSAGTGGKSSFVSNVGGGGGGGGWFGGGGGGWASNQVSGGAGGSGYISSLLTNASTKSGSTEFLSPDGVPETGHAGNGYARIIYGKALIFRGKAYTPDDFTELEARFINFRGDTLVLCKNNENLTDKDITFSCLDSRNASDTARLRMAGTGNFSCFTDKYFSIYKRQLTGGWHALDRIYDGTDSVRVIFTPVASDTDEQSDNDPENCIYGNLVQKDTVGYRINYTYRGDDDTLTITTVGFFRPLKSGDYITLKHPERAKDVLIPTQTMSVDDYPKVFPRTDSIYRKLLLATVKLSGPDAGNYLPPVPPESSWDKLFADPENYADTLKAHVSPVTLDGYWRVNDKYYDGTTLAHFNYEPDIELFILGDEIGFAVKDARFSSKHVGFNQVDMQGLSVRMGKDAGNYMGITDIRDEKGSYPPFFASIYPRPLFHHPKDTLQATGLWTAYDKLYDALDTCRITYDIDPGVRVKKDDMVTFFLGDNSDTGVETVTEEIIKIDDDISVEVRDARFHSFGATAPLRGKDAGVDKAVTLTDIDPPTDKPKPGRVEYFTHPYASKPDSIITDSVKITFTDRHLTIVLKGTDAHNYTFYDYQYEQIPEEQKSGDVIYYIYETVKTDSTLIIPDTLRADINAWQLQGNWYVPDKIYDGTTELVENLNDTLCFTVNSHSPLPDPTAPVPGDEVYVEGGLQTVNFSRRDVQRNAGDYDWIDSMQVYIQPETYSGADRLNYLLPPGDTVYAKIMPLKLTGTFTAYDREYDRTDTVHVEFTANNIVAPKDEMEPDTVHVHIRAAHFEDEAGGGHTRMTTPGEWHVIIDKLEISGADAYNYDEPDYPGVTANILYAILNGLWTAKNKAYDTTTAAEVIFTPLNEKPNADITVTVSGANFSDQWVASGKPITVNTDNIQLGGSDAPYYSLDAIVDSAPSDFKATIYPNTFITEDGNWSGYVNWRGHNANSNENKGSERNLYPPDSVHVHIKASVMQDMDVSHKDSITVYDVRFTVNSSKSLSAGMFTLRDDATFINNGNINGIDTARMVRTLPAGRNWYVGTPMDTTKIPQRANDALLRKSDGSPVSKGRVEWYDDTDYHWHPFHNARTEENAGFEIPAEYDYWLAPGRGYTAYSEKEDIVTDFKGKFNDGNVPSPGIKRTGGRIKSGYNLVSNPFPSYWQWTTSVAGQITGMETTIWYRTRNALGYRFWTYNASSSLSVAPGAEESYDLSRVPPMQAFWVSLLGDDTTHPHSKFTFDNAGRSHGNGENAAPFKSASLRGGSPARSERLLLRVEIRDDNGLYDETVVCSDAGALRGYDRYDSRKMFNNSGGEIYTFPVAEEAHLVINGLPQVQAGDSIPVGFTTDGAGRFTLRTKESTGMDTLAVDLYDRFTGSTVEDFESGAGYDFESESVPVAGLSAGARFLLVFRAKALSESFTGEASAIRLWIDRQNRLHVWNAGGEELSLFNMQGTLVERWRLASNRETVETALTPGVYVAHVGAAVEKIIVR